jgi:hypothetical protein
MSKAVEQGKAEIVALCDYFARNREAFHASGVKEAHVRQSLINPLFEALGWNVSNNPPVAPQYREVIPEDSIDVEGQQKAPDYTFRVGTLPKFFVEAKKCGVNISADPGPAYQLRRYGWSAKAALSILTDFEELAVYDCSIRPRLGEKAGYARTHYFTFQEYPDRWRELWDIFSHDAVWSGAFDQHAASKRKRGTSEVDVEFLKEIEGWRDELAHNIALRNLRLSGDELNRAVQLTIDRVVFLRMAEDRGLEPQEQLLSLCLQPDIYETYMKLCRKADDKYNSGLFHFQKEDGVSEAPDQITPRLAVDDKVFKAILQSLYFAHGSPYEFKVMPVEILGTVYERFLGKVIRLTAGHQAKVEEKPEVRKAGGVYYTPAYIVDYIVRQTVGRQIEGKSPAQLAGKGKAQPLRILDMACGSGSFLLGAYKCLLDHCLKWYIDNGPEGFPKAVYAARAGDWRLTIGEKKRILTSHVFGVDIDPQAVEVSKLSLLLKVLEGESAETVGDTMRLFHERVLPNLSDNIKCGNSLIGPDYFTGRLIPDAEEFARVNAFDWQREFPAAMKAGGFDCVIGNPPYRMLQPHNTSPETLEYLKRHFVAAEFKIDLFHLFLQLGISRLSNDGLLGFIVPATLLNNVYAETLRVWITDRCCVENISVARGKVFADADVHTCVVVCRRDAIEKSRARHEVLTTRKLDESFATNPSEFHHTPQSAFSELPGHVWNILVTRDNRKLLGRLNSEFVPLEKMAIINRGLITGDRERYFASKRTTKSHVPILAGGDVNRYLTNRPSAYVLFQRPESAGGCWDSKMHFAPHKVLVRQIGVRPMASYVSRPLAVTGNLFTVRAQTAEQEKYLLGILNSSLIEFYWRTLFADFKGSFPQVTIFSLSQLPIRPIDLSIKFDKAHHDRMVNLVDSMLALHTTLASAKSEAQRGAIRRQIEATDAEIDRLVYSLYGLTKDEIAIVEGASA